jgi:hypothetical protein
VVIEICAKYPGGPTRITVTDIIGTLKGTHSQAGVEPGSLTSGFGVLYRVPDLDLQGQGQYCMGTGYRCRYRYLVCPAGFIIDSS